MRALRDFSCTFNKALLSKRLNINAVLGFFFGVSFVRFASQLDVGGFLWSFLRALRGLSSTFKQALFPKRCNLDADFAFEFLSCVSRSELDVQSRVVQHGCVGVKGPRND